MRLFGGWALTLIYIYAALLKQLATLRGHSQHSSPGACKHTSNRELSDLVTAVIGCYSGHMIRRLLITASCFTQMPTFAFRILEPLMGREAVNTKLLG